VSSESGPSPTEELVLLRQFAPILYFDALERWRPGLVGTYLQGSAFLDGEGQKLEATPPAEPAMLEHSSEVKARLNPLIGGPGLDTQLRSAEILGAYGTGINLNDAGTVYGRVAVDTEDSLYLQYWLFYADNPCVLPPGRHDGDWEFVQVHVERSEDGWQPTQLTLAEHGKPVSRALEAGGGRPEVFVAVDSHACYFESGANPMLPLSDVCEPGGEVGAVPKVVPIPLAVSGEDWAHWHGRWGMDQGPGTLVALWLGLKRTPSLLRRLKIGAGESPPGPARQGWSWDRPAAFATRGTLRSNSIGLAAKLVHLLGKLTWPRRLPEVKVERVATGRFLISAKPTGHLARRVSLVSVAFETPEADGGARRPLARFTLRCGHPAGPFEIPEVGKLYWRAAGYNFLRQRGEPGARRQPCEVPWPLKVSGTTSDDRGARRVFEGTLTGHLRRRGAAPLEKLVGRVGWFWLRLNKTEVERLIDAARRDGLVSPLAHSRDASGVEIAKDEWALTERGREHERTRALSFRDSVVAARGIGKPVVSSAEKWGKILIAAAAPFLPFLILTSGLNVSVAIAIVVVAFTLSTGTRGETALRQAAEHWPRLRTCRPNIYAWQTTNWRPWERLPIAGGGAVYLIASAVILRVTGTWKFDVTVAVALAAVLAALAWWRLGDAWRRWYSLAKAFRDERNLVGKVRRQEPDDPCALGHDCPASRQGGPLICPRFGSKGAAAGS
jgi:hypothetical protein